MNEKETAESGRKGKKSEPEEKKIAAKKAGKSADAGKKPKNKTESNDLVINLTGELKPAAKKKSVKKTLAASGEESAPKLSEAAGGKLAEDVRIIEETLEKPPVVKTARKKSAASAKKTKVSSVSSEAILKKKTSAKKTPGKAGKAETTEAEKTFASEAAPEIVSGREESPVFKELAEPKLPALPQENRARLQIQSPHRIFFYWSVKHNPFETLHRAFPPDRARDYSFSIKLVNLNNLAEEVYPVEAAGSWWFNAYPNTRYRAEVGFSAPHRPFVRLMYSNSIETPRSEPSPNQSLTMDFAVSADQFAEVLDAAGYEQDAVEVAIAGDDREKTDAATQKAFFNLSGGTQNVEGDDFGELRFALLALASGATIESLRGQISPKLFAQLEAILRENADRLSAEKVRAVLKENFELEDEREEFLTPVFGASLVNFPRKPRLPKISPVSSF